MLYSKVLASLRSTVNNLSKMENTASTSELQPIAKQTNDYALMAQKSQLRIEQKWIEEALSKIKQQWNSLQIERLQLESNLAALHCGTSGSSHRPASHSADVETLVETQNSVLSNLDAVPNSESLDLNVPGYTYNNDTLNGFELMEEDEEEEDFEDIDLDICMLMTHNEDK